MVFKVNANFIRKLASLKNLSVCAFLESLNIPLSKNIPGKKSFTNNNKKVTKVISSAFLRFYMGDTLR